MKRTLIALLFLLASVPAFAQEAQHEFGAFVEFYNDELHRTGFTPDHTSTRDSRVLFLQQVLQRYCHPFWTMKRGDPGRPLSDEAVVWVKAGAEYRKFGDFIISGGGPNWHLGSHLDGFLPTVQPLVSPLMPLPRAAGTPGHLSEPLPPGVSFAVPGCQPPAPEPPAPPVVVTPVYPGYPGDEVFDAIAVTLFADYGNGGQPPNAGMGRWFGRTVYDWLVGNTKTLDESIAKHRAEWLAILPRPQ